MTQMYEPPAVCAVGVDIGGTNIEHRAQLFPVSLAAPIRCDWRCHSPATSKGIHVRLQPWIMSGEVDITEVPDQFASETLPPKMRPIW